MMKGNNQGRGIKATTRILFTLAFLLLSGTALNLHAQVAPAAQARFHPNRLILVPKAAKSADASVLHKRKGHKVLKRFANFQNLEVVQLAPGEDVLAAAKEYNASGAVEFAEPDYLLRETATPNDPIYNAGTQYALNNTGFGLFDADIDAPEGWDIRHDASNVIVAILDSGMRMTHEDLAANLWTNINEIPGNGIDDDGDGYVDDVHGINTITGSGDPTDDEGHGTHVAGIIGAVGNNGLGITGVAWKVQLMPIKFIGATGDGFTSDAIEGVNYAWRHGASVINASFGSSDSSSGLQTAIQSARTAGVVFVAAAGNEAANNDLVATYPANYPLDNIVSVAALNSNDALEYYSNYGATKVDLGAPGGMIISCGNSSDSSYVNMSGTSMASPVVAGVMALLKAQFPDSTPAQLIQRLLATVDPLPSLAGKCVSGGRVNLQRALSPYVIAGFTVSASSGTFPMNVQFTNTSIGEIASYSWNFGDGSPLSDLPSPSHVFTGEGSYNVTLTVQGATGAPATRTQTINVLPTYAFRSVAYEWIDPAAMTRLTLADNGVSGAQPLPFPFYFFGQLKSQIYVGANGLLGFDSVSLSTTGNSDIPTTASPNGTILPYWDNLNPAGGGAVYVGVVGEAPNRRFVASWVGVPRNTTPADTMTFQAVLSETTGRIQFNYLEVRPSSTRGGGAHATIGVEDPSGLVASKYCFDGAPNRVANGQSLQFTASSSGGLEVTPDTATTFLGNAVTLQTNAVTFTLKNTGRIPLLWSAVEKAPWLTLSAASGVLPSGGQTTVTARVNNAALDLARGSHTEMITFANLNNGNGDTTRDITAEVDASISAQLKAPTLANGNFHFEIPSAAGNAFVIEGSTDLAAWIEVSRGVVGADGIIPFSDPHATEGNRFFRAQVSTP